MPSQRQGNISQRKSTGPANIRQARNYMPTSVGIKAGNTIGALEAEFLGSILLIFITVFTDQTSSYSDKMLAVMKRGTLSAILFFILALFSTSGPNAARFSKAVGALVLAGIFLSTAGQGTISALDTFIKGDWTASAGGTDSSANAPAGATVGTSDSVANLGAQAAMVPGNVISETIDGAKFVITLPAKISSDLKKLLGFL